MPEQPTESEGLEHYYGISSFPPRIRRNFHEDPLASPEARIWVRLQSKEVKESLISLGILDQDEKIMEKDIDRCLSAASDQDSVVVRPSGGIRKTKDFRQLLRLMQMVGDIVQVKKFEDWSIDREDEAANLLGIADFTAMQNLLAKKYGWDKAIHLHKGPGNGKLMHHLRHDSRDTTHWKQLGIGDFLYFSVHDILRGYINPKELKNPVAQKFIKIVSIGLSKALREEWYQGKGNRERSWKAREDKKIFDLNILYSFLANPDPSWLPTLTLLKEKKILTSKEFEDDSFDVIKGNIIDQILKYRGFKSRSRANFILQVRRISHLMEIKRLQELEGHLSKTIEALKKLLQSESVNSRDLDRFLEPLDFFNTLRAPNYAICAKAARLLNTLIFRFERSFSSPGDSGGPEGSQSDLSPVNIPDDEQIQKVLDSFLMARQRLHSAEKIKLRQDSIKRLNELLSTVSFTPDVDSENTMSVLETFFSNTFLFGIRNAAFSTSHDCHRIPKNFVDLNSAMEVYPHGFIQGKFTSIPDIFDKNSLHLISAVRSDSHETDEEFVRDIKGNLEVMAPGGVLLIDGFRASYTRKDRSVLLFELLGSDPKFKAEMVLDEHQKPMAMMIQKLHSQRGFLSDDDAAIIFQKGGSRIPLEKYVKWPEIILSNRIIDHIEAAAKGHETVFEGLHDKIRKQVHQTLITHARGKSALAPKASQMTSRQILLRTRQGDLLRESDYRKIVSFIKKRIEGALRRALQYLKDAE